MNTNISALSVSANVKKNEKRIGSFTTHSFTISRYENAIPLPGLPSGSPDHGFCVLHQKLQMINCCIEVKIAREQNKDEKDGMTSLLTHDVAHSTRHSYRPKTNNQPIKKYLSLAVS